MDSVIATGSPAPDFELADLTGQRHRLSAQRGQVVVINFWSAECPWSEQADQELSACLSAWGSAVRLWVIASNANEKPEAIARTAAERGLDPVLLDGHQQVADLYGAVTTPHGFVVDAGGILRYQGAVNDASFRQHTPTRHYLCRAVEAVLAGDRPDPAQTPSYGCSLVRFAPD